MSINREDIGIIKEAARIAAEEDAKAKAAEKAKSESIKGAEKRPEGDESEAE